MEQNQIRTYFIYAIGEVALVMVGILLALQVNNWNNDRENRDIEQEMLLNLKAEINTNLRELRRDHALNTNSLNAWYQLLDENRTYYSPEKTDSLIGRAYNFATYDARSGVMDEIIASGSLRLIEDEQLKFMISQWSGEMNDLREDVVIRRTFWINVIQPVFQKYLPIRNADRTQVRSDYNREIRILPKEVDNELYNKFFTSMEVDGVIYLAYLNQSFVHANEKNIQNDLIEFLEIVELNIDD